MSKPITAPAMTRQEWEALPEAARYFIPWEEASQEKQIKPPRKPSRLLSLIHAIEGGKP